MEGICGHEAEEDDGVREDAVPEGNPPPRKAVWEDTVQLRE